MPVTADRADKAIGPSDMIQILCTGFFIRKPLEKLRKTHSLLEGFACCFLLIHNGTTFTVPLLYNCRCPIKRTFTTSRPVLFKADSLKPVFFPEETFAFQRNRFLPNAFSNDIRCFDLPNNNLRLLVPCAFSPTPQSAVFWLHCATFQSSPCLDSTPLVKRMRYF